jgi:quercetin dioxygenase-like cupin family protein
VSVRRAGRIFVGAVLAGFAVAGCAEPGQLGQPEPDAAPPVVAPPAPQPPQLPQLLGTGLVEQPLQIRTPGPAVYSVRTVFLPPGVSIGWHRHPGTETSIVTAGSVTLQTADDCDPADFDAGAALFVPDAVPHTLRNDGAVTAELVVAYLLAPGAPDQLSAPPACPAA